jgi:NAD(P)-dependent dehydrogenase (short-subunit alcohol dehydrogenase family)
LPGEQRVGEGVFDIDRSLDEDPAPKRGRIVSALSTADERAHGRSFRGPVGRERPIRREDSGSAPRYALLVPLPPSARHLPPATFRDQVAVVTGGGTGLGREISRGLAALGAKVIVASRDPDHHAALSDEAEREGWHVESHALDVREPDRVHALAREIVQEHGRIDVLVNNAAGNFVCPAERMSANAWRAVLGIVLDGTFYCSRHFGAPMIEARSGSILNVVATYAWTGAAGVCHSASAKAGVLALTKSLALEWARHGIRVNAIAPGPFESQGAAANLWPTPEIEARIRRQVPLGRFGTADEVAAHALYLLSPACAFVTGECFVVDGGLSLGRSFFEPGERVERR